jgi:FlaA1/EpsC-like NDP-sugar epimerase
VFLLAVWLALSLHFGMYRSRRMDTPLADMVITFKVALASWILLHAASTLLPTAGIAGFPVFQFVAVNFLALTLARSALRISLQELRRRGHNVKRLALIASPEIALKLEERIARRSHYGYSVVQRIEYRDTEDADLLDRVREVLRGNPIDDVILALPARANELSARLVVECEAKGINVRIVPDLFPLIQTDTQISD